MNQFTFAFVVFYQPLFHQKPFNKGCGGPLRPPGTAGRISLAANASRDRLVPLAGLGGDLFQLPWLHQNHAAALEFDPVRPLPDSQLPVGHFA